MRIAAVLPVLLLSHLLSAQTVSIVRDPKAIDLATRVVQAEGGVLLPTDGVSIAGHLSLSNDGSVSPIHIYGLGTERTRVEIAGSDGASVRVLDRGKATGQRATGKARAFNTLNTIAERNRYIPSLSLIADYQSPDIQLEYLGSATVGNVAVEQIAVSWAGESQSIGRTEFLKRTRTIYSIDPATMQVVQLDFLLCAERDSNAIRTYSMVYADYKTIAGRAVPTTVIEKYKDTVLYRLKIETYKEKTDVSNVSFTLNGGAQ